MNVSIARPDGTRPSCDAKVQWCLQTGETFVVGCEFVTSAGFSLLQEIAEQSSAEEAGAEPPRRRGLSHRARLWLVIVAAAVSAWWLSP